jgi:hypothetical protein
MLEGKFNSEPPYSNATTTMHIRQTENKTIFYQKRLLVKNLLQTGWHLSFKNLLYLPNACTTEQESWEELAVYFHVIRHGPHRKRRLQEFFIAAGTHLPRCYLATIRDTYTDPQTRVSHNSFIVAYIRCRWNVFTESLPNDGRRNTQTDRHTHIHWWEGIMQYAIEMVSGAMIYILSFIKICWGIQNLMEGAGVPRHTDSM